MTDDTTGPVPSGADYREALCEVAADVRAHPLAYFSPADMLDEIERRALAIAAARPVDDVESWLREVEARNSGPHRTTDCMATTDPAGWMAGRLEWMRHGAGDISRLVALARYLGERLAAANAWIAAYNEELVALRQSVARLTRELDHHRGASLRLESVRRAVAAELVRSGSLFSETATVLFDPAEPEREAVPGLEYPPGGREAVEHE